MSIRTVIFADGEYYHLYNRGNSRQVIFHDKQDHLYFITLLSTMNTEERVAVRDNKDDKKNSTEKIISIGAYCLIPNHFHILIRQEKELGISKFMQKVSTAYVMYYNKKYKRTGSLFEGKFKSKYAGEDTYLKYLFAYIHLNPLKLLDKDWKLKAKYMSREMLHFLSEYEYSSFREYSTGIFDVVDKTAFPDYFPNSSAFTKEISSWFSTSQPL